MFLGDSASSRSGFPSGAGGTGGRQPEDAGRDPHRDPADGGPGAAIEVKEVVKPELIGSRFNQHDHEVETGGRSGGRECGRHAIAT